MNLLLFDVDGTLAKSTLQITNEMETMLKSIKDNEKYEMCIVGGGSYSHIIHQIGKENEKLFTYIFSENGLVTYKHGELYHKNDIKEALGEKLIQRVINYILRYIANLELPYKRGSFVLFRTGMLYITPIGSNCSREERAHFVEYDAIHNVRAKMIKDLLNEFKDENIDVKMGGAIGIGLHPKKWDKSYILDLIDITKYKSVNFYGDRCVDETGNDWPLFIHKDINGFCVETPEHTIELLKKL